MKENQPPQILVCLSNSASNLRTIQLAADLAAGRQIQLTGIYISQSLSLLNDRNLISNFRLAESLGIKVTILYGSDRIRLLSEYVKQKGITTVIYETGYLKSWDKNQFNLLDHLLPEIEKVRVDNSKIDAIPKSKRRLKLSAWLTEKIRLTNFFKILLILLITTLGGLILKDINSDNTNIILIYILGVMLTAIVTKDRLYSLLYSLAIPIMYDFFFTRPIGSLQTNTNNLLTFGILFIVAFLSGSWTAKIQKQANLDAGRAFRTDILLKTSQRLQTCQTISEIFQVTGEQLNKLFGNNVFIWKEKDHKYELVQKFGDNFTADLLELAMPNFVALFKWVKQHQQLAGWGSTKNSKLNFILLPVTIIRGEKTAGVIAIKIDQNKLPDPLTLDLAVSIALTCGQAIRQNLSLKKQAETLALAQQEKLRADLLRGISHDLRTPLTAIYGDSDMLLHEEYQLGGKQKNELYHSINQNAAWLIDLTENLLSMTKVDNQNFKVKREPELIADIFEAALNHLSPLAEEHQLLTELPETDLIANTNGQLIVQVIVNIINNALKYTPSGSIIKLAATKTKHQQILVTIYNNGPQIHDKDQIFKLFYRGHNGTVGRKGLGIGLALCQAIISACGGKIGVENVKPVGVRFWFTLPSWEEN
ncbi:DUF4118 domain-containing protein [Liquorilactobacillus sicerae]|uniref:DUF4118 domain-containing protein n=1 Tax=Liquorilactobacillus sicerae TaxID=1416943 RepID=UPI0024811908|nr:DUF4118 domain-containing protein [Liquorilactobacillus sicerae]